MTVELDMASQRARQIVMPLIAEFPRVDPRFMGRPYQYVFAATRLSARPNPSFDSIARWNDLSGAIDRFSYGDDHMVEEHILIPSKTARGDKEGQGYLLGTALDTKNKRVRLSVFNAQNIAAGPMMQATMDRPMPLGLHGRHVAA